MCHWKSQSMSNFSISLNIDYQVGFVSAVSSSVLQFSYVTEITCRLLDANIVFYCADQITFFGYVVFICV